jgi:hypothetical protein
MKEENDMIQIRDCNEDDFEQIVKLLPQLWPDTRLDTYQLKEVFI